MGTILKTDGYENIYQHINFDKEFRDMFGKVVPKRYQNWLDKSLITLEKCGKQAVDGIQFEKLAGKEGKAGLYSIRYSRSVLNPRLIYAYFIDDKHVVLLSAFLEKSSRDYISPSKKALSRLETIKEELGL